VDFPSAKGRESAGIVDILATRKKWDVPVMEEFKNLEHLEYSLRVFQGLAAHASK
jgi:hypothetical protein